MSVCVPISQSSINVVVLRGRSQLLMSSNNCGLWSRGISTSFSSGLYSGKSEINHVGLSICTKLSSSTTMGQTIKGGFLGSCCSKQRGNTRFFSSLVPRKRYHEISLACQNLNLRLLVPKQKLLYKVKCNLGPISWPRGCASVGLLFGLLVCNLSSEPAHAEANSENENPKDDSNEYQCNVKFSHGKKVYTDYSVIGIPGDGRCLFRSVAHGACLRSGKTPPSERIQRELADDLRAKVADEFIKRREETEWFIEGDFDTYISQIRKPHVWGGEPELFIASHVLQVPITVYMYDQDAGGLIPIAEYGQEYGKENPVRVLYHGFGHYDALEIPKKKGLKPRL
ncbi:OTU domain-containing protein At3g57810-like [Abrus precatorius]|uniref:Ubiquitin thioesterase OTU n=1 Tax=Abrus precatorius TaxID=3816 RepID=A0A8B8MFX7_ABRPR|nr:OTU domain-containing protein At3g57810-like [Abrus precatorius]XP_027366089.1 OTU domain-containing protein At3g57810-like [Abrus precatorius]XP_027366090.1 OTU domain-containing protein At3g57810-like [Abrus precatorius]